MKSINQLFRRLFFHAIWAAFSLLITVVIVVGLFYVFMQIQLPDVSVLKEVRLQVPLRIYTRDGQLISEYGAKRRIPVTLDQVPPLMIKAVLATEDARFYSHPGIDFIGLARAGLAVLTTGRKVQGASTITMQVARNFFLDPEKTYTRKIKEILLALKIDQEFSKDKILELYLNKVYFGQRAYGVAAAAQVYYGRDLDQLTLAEMAMIAGLPQAPSRDNPLTNPDGALKRRNHVLDRMLEVNFINKALYQKAISTPLTASYHVQTPEVRAPYIAEMVRQEMFNKYGEAAYEQGFHVYTTIIASLQNTATKALQDGLIAFSDRHGYQKSTLHLRSSSMENQVAVENLLSEMRSSSGLRAAAVIKVQANSAEVLFANGGTAIIPWSGLSWARPALSSGYAGPNPQKTSDILQVGDVVWVSKQNNDQWRLAQIPPIQGAIVVLNPQTGAILALSGGFDYRNSSFNRAVQAERQPGSNFKPFIYSAALDKGYTLASVVNDAPIVIDQQNGAGLWRPINDEMRFFGPTRLHVALAKSRNLVTIRLLHMLGIRHTIPYLARFGFDTSKLPKALSLALGTGLVTPLQMAVGYSVFANGGYRVNPFFIQQITDQADQLVFDAVPPQACEACITNPEPLKSQMPNHLAPQVITAQNAYLITHALQDVIRMGTGVAAKSLGRNDLAGKTGTTNQQVDAWFSGYNSNIEATVWVGYDDLKSLHEYGAQAALPIWIQFMREALRGKPEASLPQPSGIVTVRIDPNTGLLAGDNQPNAIFEVFRKEDAPTEFASSAASASSVTSDGNSGGGQEEPLF